MSAPDRARAIPIDWVFKRKGMPVEIVAEYENFRKIRDWQGASGWVYQGLLTGKRSFIIPSKAANLYKTPATVGRGGRQARARGDGRDPLLPGRLVPGQGLQGVSGWLQRTEIWGVYKSEPIN